MVFEKTDWKLIAPANVSNFPQIGPEKIQSLLASGKKMTLLFFRSNLELVVIPWPHPVVGPNEVKYVARFLTRFSMSTPSLAPSILSFIHLPTFENMVKLCNDLINRPDYNGNPQFLEQTACQILLLSGFYFKEVQGTYDRNTTVRLGQGYFMASATNCRRKKKDLLQKMAKNFKAWQDFLHFLSWHFAKLREEGMLIKVPKPEEPTIKLTN